MVSPVYAAEKCKLYLDIEFEGNLFFDKYDVDLYFDDQEMDTLPHGKYYTKLLDTTTGSHTVKFVSSKDSTITGSVLLNLEKDATFKCKLIAWSTKIEVSNQELKDSLSGTSIKMPDVSYQFLPEALKTLAACEYTNISCDSTDDNIITMESNWMVVAQNIEAGQKIDKNEPIKLTCKKISKYLEESFLNLNVADAMKKAKEIDCEVIFTDKNTGRNINSKFTNTFSSELKNWTVEEVYRIDAKTKIADLYLVFTGEQTVPNVIGIPLNYAVKELKAYSFANIVFKKEDGSVIKRTGENEWKVVAQSVESGKRLSVNETIELTCVSYYEEEKAEEVPENENVVVEETESGLGIFDAIGGFFNQLENLDEEDLHFELPEFEMPSLEDIPGANDFLGQLNNWFQGVKEA